MLINQLKALFDFHDNSCKIMLFPFTSLWMWQCYSRWNAASHKSVLTFIREFKLVVKLTHGNLIHSRREVDSRPLPCMSFKLMPPWHLCRNLSWIYIITLLSKSQEILLVTQCEPTLHIEWLWIRYMTSYNEWFVESFNIPKMKKQKKNKTCPSGMGLIDSDSKW